MVCCKLNLKVMKKLLAICLLTVFTINTFAAVLPVMQQDTVKKHRAKTKRDTAKKDTGKKDTSRRIPGR
jgi:hypothetical protein